MAWEWLGVARANRGDDAAAIGAFQMALQLHPGNTVLREQIRQAEDRRSQAARQEPRP